MRKRIILLGLFVLSSFDINAQCHFIVDKLKNINIITTSINSELVNNHLKSNEILIDKVFKNQSSDLFYKGGYIYVNTFFFTGYNGDTSKYTYSIILYDENIEFQKYYLFERKISEDLLDVIFKIKDKKEIDEYEIDYVTSILNMIKNDELNKIKEEQFLLENKFVKSFNSYEYIYQIIPNKLTNVYQFDLFWNKLFNGDFDENVW